MISVKLLIIAGLCVSFGDSKSTSVSPGCMYNGKQYHTGQSFDPTPCEHCYCPSSGHVACAITDCFFAACVDPIHDPTKCCPVCPNGPNCKFNNGTILKKGVVYKPAPDVTCMCPENTFGLQGSQVICYAKASVRPPTVQPVS